MKRPPEMQNILGSLFNLYLSNENEDIDLKDRTAFYYRILQTNIDDLSKVLKDGKIDLSIFIEDELNSKVNFSKIFFIYLFFSKENNNIDFNTLSVIYQKPANKFTKSFEHFNIQRFSIIKYLYI